MTLPRRIQRGPLRFLFLLVAVASVEAFLPTTTLRPRFVALQDSESSDANDASAADASDAATKKKKLKPDLLEPFPAAADPQFALTGPVGQGSFCLSRSGPPLEDELANENMLQIVESTCSDLEVNTLIWKCLGYRFVERNENDGSSAYWSNEGVFPKWKERYPTPPDCIGMQRIYSKEVDQPSLRANQALVRSVPLEHKLSLKQHLRPLGFTGYQYAELTPNKTRRAQCANWLIYYREQLFGYSLEELQQRRKERQEQEEAQKEANKEEWKPPLKEVF